jgi:CheY-like chemotaxis protein
MMPVMDGFAFRREQLSDPKLAGIPVVVLSADGRVTSKGVAFSVDLVLKKPMRMADILGAARRFCT